MNLRPNIFAIGNWRFAVVSIARQMRERFASATQAGFSIPNQKSKIKNQKTIAAFTIVELLVVIAIIAILAAMLLPTLGGATQQARKTEAKKDVSEIVNAITEYDSEYSHMPVSTAVQQSGSNYVTCGGIYTSTSGSVYPSSSLAGWGVSPFGYSTPVGIYVISNSDVMSILLDLTNFPNSTTATINANHQKNASQKIFLSAKFTGDTASPGIGTDLNYRDPWGNPYIITMNLNDNNQAEDPFYAPPWMSSSTGPKSPGAGVDGLSYQASDGNYLFHGNVMVWSMGPNGPFYQSPSSFTYTTPPAKPASGVNAWALDPSNKNHILSWAQ